MHFRQLDLNLLVALDALLTERNITEAGRRVHLTQSAMSGALARLREYFDDELLVQVGRKMVPTPLAENLFGRRVPVHETHCEAAGAERCRFEAVDVSSHPAQGGGEMGGGESSAEKIP